jgi:hypothetical protein
MDRTTKIEVTATEKKLFSCPEAEPVFEGFPIFAGTSYSEFIANVPSFVAFDQRHRIDGRALGEMGLSC